VATDVSGNVYVTDQANYRIQAFSATGTYLNQWGSRGSANGQFQWPACVAVDASGNVYVSEFDGQRVQKFGPVPTPTEATTWGRLKRLFR
jgi:DNA-binding beta-propeller fold protein YncE